MGRKLGRPVRALVTAALFSLGASDASAARLPVAASITPVHSLVAAVMGDAGAPALLIPPGQSEHSSVLRPSGAEALARSRLVYRIARGFEPALDKPIASLATPKSIVELARAPGIRLLVARAPDDEEFPGMTQQSGDLYLWANLHIWLDPVLAKAMTAEIVRTLSAADPTHAQLYAANGVQEAVQLNALDQRIADALKPVADVPFVVFHDAYAYFEARYPLNQVGIVELSPGQEPGARHISALRDKIRKTHAVCVFAEPQFEPKILATITEGLGVRTGTLDPLGADLTPGPDLYFTLLTNLTRSLRSCLKP